MYRRLVQIKSISNIFSNEVSRLSSKAAPKNSEKDTDIVWQVRNNVKLEIEEARKCVMIPHVFRGNVSQAINQLQDYMGMPAEHTVFFNYINSAEKKPVLLVKLKEVVPWKERFKKMRFRKQTEPLPDTRGLRMDFVKYKDLSPRFINECENLLDQINQLYDTAKMSSRVRMCHYTVISVLIDCLQSQNPEIFKGDIIPFGSGPCGLALQGSSDLDLVYLEDGKYQKREERQDLLRQAARRLKKVNTLSNIKSILRASVPIIRFTEFTTELNIDLSVSSSDGVKFCKLFQTLDDLDDRIHPLIVTLRFWSKINNLQSVHLSNFVLSMLIIHFLQYQRIIPPFRRLIKDYQVQEMPTSNKSKLDNLLVEFFKFYSTFDFDQNTINLYEGTAHTRSPTEIKFSECLLMESPYIPHCDTVNIGKSVTPSKLKEFQSLCNKSFKLIEKHKNKLNKDEEWGLNCILPCR